MTIRAVSLALAALLIIPLAPLAALPPAQAVAPNTTYYLHGQTPAGNLEESATFAVGLLTPSMDATPPATPAPKLVGTEQIAWFTSNDNPTFGYWDAPLHADLSDAVATLYVMGSGPVSVELLADGARVGSASADVTLAPSAVTVSIPTTAVPVAGTLRLIVAVSAGAVLYDSTQFPSSLSFVASDYTPPSGGSGGSAWVAPSPASGWGAVRLADDAWAGREASLALDPTDAQRIALCSPTGVPQTSYGHSLFVRSQDGGDTFAAIEVEQKATDTRKYAFEGGDCDITFDAGGTMYTADTWLGDLSVGHSTDGGDTWDGTAVATTAPVVDRPWLVGGPAGTVHLTWQDVQFAMPTAIWYERSTDYGQTFTPAVPIATSHANQAFSWEGNLVVAPGGHDLYLAYTTRADAEYLTSSAESVWVAASHDDGLTWTQNLVRSNARAASYLYPSLGLDSAGGLHVAWAMNDTHDQAVWYSHSADQGVSWSAPVKVASGVGAYGPWIVGAGPGQAVVAWLGTPSGFADSGQDWYFYAYRESGADTGAPAFTGGKTTTTPVFVGAEAMPEFNQVRLDGAGKIHLGMSALVPDANGGHWGLFHQMET
ncbi:MAG: hypothetical protein QOE90_3280 [Thermoplasmata archaeon]|jgi:hypothetical protein|nr:hypothetical protein [Thermoplasmata archaeon]